MRDFTHQHTASRTVFGVGALARVAEEVRALGLARVMLIGSPSAAGAAATIATSLGGDLELRWEDTAQHVPVELAERARGAAAEHGVDGVVCVGGGSAVGLAKAVALTHRVPVVAVPTTYAGSEQTPVYGLTGDGHKETGTDPAVQPRVVVYDPALTVGLPARVTGTSAFNALAHAIEGLWAPGANPITSTLAHESVRAITASLPRVIDAPDDLDGRGDLLYGAALAGMVLGATSAGMHHKICHVLGGRSGLVHADAHAVVLPHVVAFNAPALPTEMSRLSSALGAADSDPAGQLWQLAARSGLPTRLSDLAGPAGPLDRGSLLPVAEEVCAEVSANPVPLSVPAVHALLERAFDGAPPLAG